MTQENNLVTFGKLGGGMSYDTKLAAQMDFEDFLSVIEGTGQAIVESAKLQNARETIHQLLEEYAPYKFENAPTYMTDFYIHIKRLATAIDVLNVQAGLVTCSIPGCTNTADVPTTLGNIHFCTTCFEEQRKGTCGE